MKSYLQDRTQYVQEAEKKSKIQVTNIGTSQGSRLSPIPFLCLMKGALDIQVIFASWPKWSYGKRADDTQSIKNQ
jgi:hypothetical protein